MSQYLIEGQRGAQLQSEGLFAFGGLDWDNLQSLDPFLLLGGGTESNA